MFYNEMEMFYDARQKCLCKGGDIAMFITSMEYKYLTLSHWYQNSSCKGI